MSICERGFDSRCERQRRIRLVVQDFRTFNPETTVQICHAPPHVYRSTTTLSSNGRIFDSQSTDRGSIPRSVTTDPYALALRTR